MLGELSIFVSTDAKEQPTDKTEVRFRVNMSWSFELDFLHCSKPLLVFMTYSSPHPRFPDVTCVAAHVTCAEVHYGSTQLLWVAFTACGTTQ